MQKSVEEKYDHISTFYQEQLFDDKYYKYITEKFAASVKGKVLYAACGNGYITNLLAKTLHVTGIDISAGMIKQATKKYSHIPFNKMDMRSLKFKDSSFDGVFCFQAFQHVQPNDQKKVLSEFSRVLKPGGVLMVNTINVFHPEGFMLSVKNKINDPQVKFGEVAVGGKTRTYRYFCRYSEFRKKIKNTGFEITYHESPPFHKWIQVWARKVH